VLLLSYFQLVRRSIDFLSPCQFCRKLLPTTVPSRLALVPEQSNADRGKPAVRMIEYSPEHFDALQRVAKCVGPNCNLGHRPFVDYYYASSDWCRLFMILTDDGSAIATIGLERMPFQYDGHKIIVGFGSNFHSLRSGLGTYLFLHWQKSCPVGLVYGGSEETHKIIRRQNWSFFTGVRNYELNKTYLPHPGQPKWRVAAKWVLRHTGRRKRIAEFASRIPASVTEKLSVREEQNFTHDLLPCRSPFRFRFAPSPEYLNWRYNPSLSFVRYRVFRVLDEEKTVGYVILNESAERILVAQCDGEDAETLAYGTLLSILQAGHTDTKPRFVSLVSCHPGMQKIYERFGFKKSGPDRPFALGLSGANVRILPDTSNWLVNLDWGDNGLLGPLIGQSCPVVLASRPAAMLATILGTQRHSL